MKLSKKSAPLGASLVVLSSVFYAGYGIWTRLMDDFFGAFTQATLRHIITAFLLLVIAIGLGQVKKVHWLRDARWLGLSAISSAIIPASLYYAYLNAGVGISQALIFMGIMIGMFFFGWLFAQERYTKDKWLATALGTIGIWLVFAPSLGKGSGWLALALAFVGGLATGLNVVASKKLPYSALQTALIVWSLGIFANLPFMFLFKEPTNWLHPSSSWLYLVLFAATSVIATWSIIRGVKLIEAGVTGILQLFEIIFGVLFGVLFFAERPGKVVLAGMVLILAAALIPTLKDLNIKKGTLES